MEVGGRIVGKIAGTIVGKIRARFLDRTPGVGAGDGIKAVRVLSNEQLKQHVLGGSTTATGLDSTGKVHGDLPTLAEIKRLSVEELEHLQTSLSESVQRRIDVTVKMGSDPGHAERQAAEQRLIQQIKKVLSDR
jgi:hypothetical protein